MVEAASPLWRVAFGDDAEVELESAREYRDEFAGVLTDHQLIAVEFPYRYDTDAEPVMTVRKVSVVGEDE